MTLPIFISLFAVNFIAILTKSFQQKNVQFNKLLWIFPTSMIMSAMEVFLIGSVATLAIASGSMWAMVPMGLGAAAGSIAGVLLFKKLSNEDKPE